MSMADVIVLRLTGTDGVAGAVPEGDGPGRGRVTTEGGTGSGPGRDAASSPGGTGPAAWLPRVLGDASEETTEDDGVHRYVGARLLHTSRCRHLEVSGSPADPATVRLTVVWADDAPTPGERAAFVSWWTARAADAGWEPAETDDLVGAVEVARFVPADAGLDETVAPPVRVHALEPPRSRTDGARTSGRRT